MKATTAWPEVQFMEEYLQRLRQYLTQGGLTAVDARDGMVAAYLVVSRLNQLQGNPDVGLKQDEPGLYQHFSGFLGAIFWERGYNYDHPTVQQLGEVKMMLDGTAQIFAMPENLQMALNEICDFLLARAGNQPAVVSSAVMDLLESHAPVASPVSPDIANFDFSAPKITPEPERSAAPEPAPEPPAAPLPAAAEPVAEPAAEPARAAQSPASVELEPDLVALFDEAMKEETPPAAPEPEAAPVFEIVEGAPQPETPEAAAFPAAPETTAAEPSRFGLEPEKTEAGPLPEDAAPEPVKKKRGRKKSVETAEPKPKAVRKKAKAVPADPAPQPLAAPPTDAEPAAEPATTEPVAAQPVAPDTEPAPAAPAGLHEDEKLSWTMFGAMPADQASVSPEPAADAAAAEPGDTGEPAPAADVAAEAEPPLAAAAWETDTAVLDSEVQASPSSISELGSFPDAVPEAEAAPDLNGYAAEVVSDPVWTPPAEELVSAPVAYGANEEIVSAPQPAAAEAEVVSAPVSGGWNEEVVSTPMPSYADAAPTPAPSSWNAPEPVPAEQPPQPSYRPAADPAWSGRTPAEPKEDYADAEPPAKAGWGAPLAVGLVVGLVLGGAAAYMIANSLASSDADSAKAASDKLLALAKADTDKVKAEADKMRATLKEAEAAWRKTPDKPAHLKVGAGVLLYWPNEGMMRKYYVYRGRGPAGNMVKVTEEPLDINFLYLARLEPGPWRFAVSALTKEGVETDRGEPALLAFPLK
jgi:hypothetical protein